MRIVSDLYVIKIWATQTRTRSSSHGCALLTYESADEHQRLTQDARLEFPTNHDVPVVMLMSGERSFDRHWLNHPKRIVSIQTFTTGTE